MTIDNEALYKKYKLNLEDFESMDIDFDALKLRTANCLKSAGIYKLDQLLGTAYDKLSEIKSLGMTSLLDIENYVKSIDGAIVENNDLKNRGYTRRIKSRSSLIYNGDFSDELYKDMSDAEIDALESYKEGYLLLGPELVLECRDNPSYVFSIKNCLRDFIKRNKKFNELKSLRNKLSCKLGNFVKPYIDLYSSIHKISPEFYNLCSSEGLIIDRLFDKARVYSEFLDDIISFLDWASYDLCEELYSFLNTTNSRKSSNSEIVLKLRAKKMTLQEVGDKLGITRERVRQIEKKIVDPFCRWQRNKKFLPRLSADFNGETILESTDIQEYFGEMTEVVLYLLQCADDEYFSYDKNTDTVIIVDDDITDLARDYVEKLPDSFGVEKLKEFMEKAIDDYSIPEDVFNREIGIQYKVSGSYYHRSKLSLEKMYIVVLGKYYPDGMNVYDEEELSRFRHLLTNEFGEVSLPKKNRSISAAIGRCCILCGRGKYRVKSDDNIPDGLISQIYNYIMNSEKNLFFMNEIFLEFEDELRDAGIDNRFFLQGVLREKYDNELFFRRDYVSKDSENLSLDRDIKLFIKRSKQPVTKDQIRAEFPGITEIMLSMAVADDEIINYHGSYLHSSNLDLYDYDKIYITNVVEHVIGDNMPHHCNEIYETILNDNPDLLNRLGIYYQYSLFSLLQYMFDGYYEFERPYIAHEGVNINKPVELLEEFVSANDLFEITELLELAKEYHYTIFDILKFLNSWNDTHLLISNQEMASLDYIGMNDEIAQEVEETILQEIGEQSLVADLKCIYKLPKINVPWNEWLVYSVINGYSEKLEAHTTSSQFRRSSPVLSRIGKFNRDDYNNAETGQMIQTVDLNDMDAVTDYIMEDFDIEW